ncbi:MAG: HAD family phosphatase [Asgard group archaeon]|nr:HAD family phosphatase [Asgard group archaeon]
MNSKVQLAKTGSKKHSKKTPSKIKGIIFDFDGVLSSFQKRIGGPIISAALMVKSDLTPKVIKENSLEIFSLLTTLEQQPSKSGLFKLAFNTGKKFGMSNFQALRFVITTAIIYSKNRKTVVPLVGVRETLRELLTQDYKTILLTNTSRSVINKAIEKIPEIEEFDLVLTRDDVKILKPNKAGIIKALEMLNLKADEVITIGDQASDIIAGNRAGLLTVAVSEKVMKFTKPHIKAHNPDFFINDIRELKNILMFLRDCIIDDIRTTIDLTEKPLQEYVLDKSIVCSTNP